MVHMYGANFLARKGVSRLAGLALWLGFVLGFGEVIHTQAQAPTNLTVTEIRCNRLSFSWNHVGAGSYHVFLANDPNFITVLPGYQQTVNGPFAATVSFTTPANLNPAQTYHIRVCSAANCAPGTAATTSATTASRPTITASPNTHNLCPGDNPVTLTAAGGVSYVWQPGGLVGASINVSPAATTTFTVVGSDVAGCTSSATATVTVSSSLSFTVAPTDPRRCLLSATPTTLTASGAITYLWQPGGMNGATVQVSPNATTTYTIEGRAGDALGCVGTVQVTVTVNPEPTVVGAITQPVCFNQPSGGIDLTVSGGSGNYVYQWSDGGTTEDRANLLAGTYSVTACDVDGISCCTVQSFTLDNPPAIQLQTLAFQDVSCNGGSDGSITIDVIGGTGGYTFQWDNTTQTTATITNLTAGSYCVTVTDANGCTANHCVTLTQPTLPLTVVLLNNTSVRCNGSVDGSLSVTGSGGVPLYNYLWSNGQVTPTALNLPPGGYCVTVSDQNGCEATGCYTVAEPAVLNIGLEAIEDVSCNGLDDGLIYVDVSGGTGPYTYDWSHILGNDDIEDVEDLPANTYTLTVTDSRNCTTNRSFDIIEPQLLQVTLANAQNIACSGAATGFIDVQVQGGTQPYTFSWTRDGNPLPDNTEDLFNLVSGGYIVTVRDANNCPATLAVNLTQPTVLVLTQIFLNNVRCFGGSDGSVGYDVTGGTPPYSFRWSTGATSEDINNLASNTYCLTVTDAAGCRVSDCPFISQPTPVVIDIVQVSFPSCNGSADGSINIDVTGGTAPYNFAWTNLSFAQNQANLAPGQYCVDVLDANDCAASECVNIGVPNALTIQQTGQTNNGCPGETDGTLSINVTGGTPFSAAPLYTFRWTRDGNNYSTAQNLTLLYAGVYCVTATDANNCTATACYTVTDPSAIQLAVVNQVNPTCNGAANGSITVQLTGGTAPFTTTWTGPNGFSSNQQNIAGLRAGVYNLIVRDVNGCNTNITVELTEPSAVSVRLLEQINVSCFNFTDGRITVEGQGGTPDYTYRWSRGPLDVNQTITNLASGSYSVTVTDAQGCTAQLSNLGITQPSAALALTTTEKVDVDCNDNGNGRITVQATGGTQPYTFIWDTGDANVTTLSQLETGTYCVTLTDANGCTQDQCEEIIQPDPLTVSLFGSFSPFCAGQTNGSISIQVNGGVLPYTVTWSNINPQPANRLNPTGLPAGVYTATATDANGCVSTLTVELTEPQPLSVTVSRALDITCANGSNGLIDLDVTGGAGNYSYAWSNGEITPNVNGLTPGTYSVTVTDQNGCTASTSVTLLQLTPLSLQVIEVVGTGCGPLGTGMIRTQATGGAQPYTFSWSHNAALNASAAAQLAAGCYTVSATDANGCTVALTQCITGTPPITVNVVNLQHVNCAGNANGSIEVAISGGTPPYGITWLPGGQTGVTRLDNLSGGNYFVVVTDQRSCFVVTPAIVVDEPAPLDFIRVFANQPSCNGFANGSIGVDVTGGTQPYSYRWDNGAITEQQNQMRAGTYCVTVTDARGCIINACVELGEPAPITFPIDQLIPDDCTNSGFGAIELTVTGGTGPYNFIWDNGETTEDLENIRQGTYCLRVIDFNSCDADTCIDVPRADDPTVVFDPDMLLPVCSNAEPVPLSASIGGGTFAGPGVIGNEFHPEIAGPGVHRITYVGLEFGCNFQGEFDMTVIPAPNAAQIRIGLQQTIPDFCADNNALYLMYYTPVQSGVSGIISGNGVIRQGNQYRFNPSIAGVGTHTLTLELLGTNGCLRTVDATVNVGQPFSISLTSSASAICAGEEVTLTTGGANTYTWAPSSGLSCSPNCANVGPTVTAKPSTTRTYTVTGFRLGCQAKASALITVRTPAPIRILPSRTTICQGETVTLTASSTDPTYQYVWSDGLNNTLAPSLTSQPQATTTYTLTGVNADNCLTTATLQIRVNPALVMAVAEPSTICLGSSSVLNASSTQPGIYSYVWSPPTGLSSSFGGTVTARPTQTTTYTVLRSGTGSCRTATVTVSVVDNSSNIQLPTTVFCELSGCVPLIGGAPAGGTWTGAGVNANTFCPDQAGPGNHVLTYAGTVGGCNYSRTATVTVNAAAAARIANWKELHCLIGNPYVFVSIASGATISGPGMLADGRTFQPSLAGTGTHALTVSAPVGTGCFVDTTYQVRVVIPNVALTGLDPVYCSNAPSVVLSATPAGGNFAINATVRPGSLTGNVFHPSVAGAGLYYITYHGVDGPCVYSTTVPVRVTNALTVTNSIVSPTCPGCADGSITLNASGGTAPYTYSISGNPNNPPTSPTFTGLLPGTYNLEVRDAGGCSQILAVTLQAQGTNEGPFCNAPVDISVDITNEGDIDVTWSPVAGALGYEVEYRLLGSPTPTLLTTETNAIILTGLEANRDYELVIRTRCSGERLSPNSDVIPFFTDLPQQECITPTITSLAPAIDNILVRWTFAPSATGYEVSWRAPQNSIAFSSFIVGPAVSQYLITGLSPSTVYEVRVRTICGNNLSGFSPSMTTSTLVQPDPCDIPAIFSVEPLVSTARVNWGLAQGAISYVISWRRQVVGSPWITVTINSASTTSYLVTNLLPGATYELRMRSRCNSTQSSWSPIRVFTTQSARSAISEAAASEFSVYPNPSSGLVNVQLGGGLSGAGAIRLYDVQGRLIDERHFDALPEGVARLDYGGLPAGVYLMRIDVGDARRTLRLVLQP